MQNDIISHGIIIKITGPVLDVRFEENEPEINHLLVTDDGVFTEAAIDNDDGFLRIPAGFSGNVGVPLAADALKAAWGSDAFRVEDIPSLALLFNADTALSGKTVYLHDFGFASFAEDGQGSPITGGVLPTAATVAALCGLSLGLLTGIKKKSAR